MKQEVITEAENKLISLLKSMKGIDNDFGLLVSMTCRHEGLTEEIVEWIEKEHIDSVKAVEAWLFGEEERA